MNSKKAHSYHIFLFPFQWRINGLENQKFGEQISFRNIKFPAEISNWERVFEPKSEEDRHVLYNEKNYFYEFVHDALYDNGKNDNSNIVHHYERKEVRDGNAKYIIKVNRKEYVLSLEYINLNLYSTGVGVLSLYAYNTKYPNPDDVLNINQFGRRVYPPFVGSKNNEAADELRIEGLNGVYCEDFERYNYHEDSNTPSAFLRKMVNEVAPNISIKAVIDDRMYTMSWYKNDELASEFGKEDGLDAFLSKDIWYEYVFVDSANNLTCQNNEMQKELAKKATYSRWQKYNSLYGISKYSFVYLTNTECPVHLTGYFETEYVRMAELILVQKASVLRFSAEVTNISSMEKRDNLSERVRSLYKEYIRFVNQIHFREVSAQDQAIEIYTMLYNTAGLEKHVEKLDGEIGELHNHVALEEDRGLNRTMSHLTKLATLFVPATFVAGLFGMNNDFLGAEPKECPCWTNEVFLEYCNYAWLQIVVIVIVVLVSVWYLNKRTN